MSKLQKQQSAQIISNFTQMKLNNPQITTKFKEVLINIRFLVKNKTKLFVHLKLDEDKSNQIKNSSQYRQPISYDQQQYEKSNSPKSLQTDSIYRYQSNFELQKPNDIRRCKICEDETVQFIDLICNDTQRTHVLCKKDFIGIILAQLYSKKYQQQRILRCQICFSKIQLNSLQMYITEKKELQKIRQKIRSI